MATPSADHCETDETSARGGLAIVPNPFQRTRHGVPARALADRDGVEVFNAWAMTGVQNRRAGAFARRRGYPGLGSSDAHHPEAVGTAYTELAVDGGLTVLDAIERGRCRAVAESTPTVDYVRKAVVNLTQRMRLTHVCTMTVTRVGRTDRERNGVRFDATSTNTVTRSCSIVRSQRRER